MVFNGFQWFSMVFRGLTLVDPGLLGLSEDIRSYEVEKTMRKQRPGTAKERT